MLTAAHDAEVGSTENFADIVYAIQQDHLLAARSNVKSKDILDWYVQRVEEECDNLMRILQSAQHLEEVSTNAVEKIISKGEKLSCLFMTAMLEEQGMKAQYVDLSSVTKFDSSGLDDKSVLGEMSTIFASLIRGCADKIPVLTGYFGNVPGGLLNSIGRGYTDLCAALVAVGLQAQELQIWKEVDGIYTADPRKVPTARLLSSVTPAEAAELTFYGSEVIHPFTMEQVVKAKIPIRIRNVSNIRSAGTTILPQDSMKEYTVEKSSDRMIDKAQLQTLQNDIEVISSPKRPTAVTVKHDIVLLNVRSNKRTRTHGFLKGVFSVLDNWHLSVDLISSSEILVSMALQLDSALSIHGHDNKIAIEHQRLRNAVAELRTFGTVDLIPNMAIVSLVGRQLKNMIGISGRLFTIFGDNNINIEMISQGTSTNALSSS